MSADIHRSRPTQLALLICLAVALESSPASIGPVYPTATEQVRSSESLGAHPQARTTAWSSHPSSKALRWAQSQLRRMSLEEKVGQLISIPVYGKFYNQDAREFRELTRQVKENHVGGLILYRGSVYESVHLANRLQRLSRYPLLISADMETGAGMRFEDAV